MYKRNQWSDEQERVYQAECRGEIVEDALKFFPIKKFQNFGPLIKKDKAGRFIRAFHKFSLLPLIPSMVVDSQLEVLHKRMCKEGIGYKFLHQAQRQAIAVLSKCSKQEQKI